MNKFKFNKVAEVQNLAARRETRKRESRESCSQVTNQLEQAHDTSMKDSIAASETEILESIAEQPLDEVDPSKVGMFTVKTFNQVLTAAVKRGELAQLFDEFWFENETCCLFGDSNVGKSILAVQIARDIAKNGRKVLYFDFELSESQILRRYSDSETKRCYSFPNNLYHVSLNHMMSAYSVDELPDQIINQIENLVKETSASVMIIDNLTWIAYNSRSAKMASELMKRLSAMKAQYKLSILILAHTPKRNLSKPINQNDLAGSRMIMNFLDSAFAIGCSSKDPRIRYIKQIKVRYTEMKYGGDNVWLCEIESIRSFLTFRRFDYGIESEHLKTHKDDDKEALIAKIKVMRASGMSIREIAVELGMSPATVDRYSKK